MTATAQPLSGQDDGKVLTIIEHLQELRRRLTICALALVVGVGASLWPLTKYAIHFLVIPAQKDYPGFRLHQFQLFDYWSTYFRVSLLLGVALAMPVIMYQILAFVGPGLTPRERRWVFPIVFGATAMFILGMAFGYYMELPSALRFLLHANSGDVEATIGIQAYIDTVTRLLFITGIVFEVPFVIMGLAKIGIVNSRKLWGWTRYAIVLSSVLAGFITPSVDPVTMIVVMIPIVILYFLGIALAKLVEDNSLFGARR